MKLLFDFLFSFRGRTGRKRYWLAQIIIWPLTWFLSSILDSLYAEYIQAIAFILAIPVIWIDIAVGAKRYHDIGISGWRQLLTAIPFIGPIWVLIECGFIKGDSDLNQFGYPNVIGSQSIYKISESFEGSKDTGESRSISSSPKNTVVTMFLFLGVLLVALHIAFGLFSDYLRSKLDSQKQEEFTVNEASNN